MSDQVFVVDDLPEEAQQEIGRILAEKGPSGLKDRPDLIELVVEAAHKRLDPMPIDMVRDAIMRTVEVGTMPFSDQEVEEVQMAHAILDTISEQADELGVHVVPFTVGVVAHVMQHILWSSPTVELVDIPVAMLNRKMDVEFCREKVVERLAEAAKEEEPPHTCH